MVISLLEFHKKIDELIHNGELNQALVLIDNFIPNEILDDKSIIEISILKCKILLMIGKYNEGIELCQEVLPKILSSNSPLLELDARIHKISLMLTVGKFENLLKDIYFVEELITNLEEYPKEEILSRKGELLLFKGDLLSIKGNNQLAITSYENALTIFKALNNREGIGRTMNRFAFVNRDLSKYDLSLEQYNEALTIQDEIKDLYGKMFTLKDMGTVYLYRGEREKAAEYYQKSYEIAEKFGNIDFLGRLLNNFGIVQDFSGNLRSAIEYYEKSLKYQIDFGNKEVIAKSYNNIGLVYLKMGNLEQAITNLEKSLVTFQEIGNIQNILNSFNNLGRVYSLQGNYDKALINFQMSLNMMDKINSKLFNSITLYNFITTSVLKNDLEKAQEKLEIMKLIDQEASEPIIHLRTILAEAMILKRSSRAKNRVKAEEYLEMVIASDIPHDDQRIDAMLNLCDLKLQELKESEDIELLEEVKSLVNKILEIAKRQNSKLLYAESYWFLSQLALLELDFNTARSLLTQAQIIAEEWDIRSLALKMAYEHDKLLDSLELWEKLSQKNTTLTERMELVEIEDFFRRIYRDRKFDSQISPEEPIMFMLLKSSGAPIYSKQYQQDEQIDEALVCGFLSAINVFAKQTFASVGPIERIRHNDYTIILHNLQPYLVCYIFKGQSYSALQRMIRIIDTIKHNEKIWDELMSLVNTTCPLSETSEVLFDNLIDEVLLVKETL